MDIKRVERIERNKYKRKIKRYRKFARLRRNIFYAWVKRNKRLVIWLNEDERNLIDKVEKQEGIDIKFIIRQWIED